MKSKLINYLYLFPVFLPNIVYGYPGYSYDSCPSDLPPFECLASEIVLVGVALAYIVFILSIKFFFIVLANSNNKYENLKNFVKSNVFNTRASIVLMMICLFLSILLMSQ